MSRDSWQTSWRWTDEEAANAIDAWDRSGLGAAAFGRLHRVSAWRLYWWRRRLAQPKALEISPTKFVPAEIVETSARVTVRICTDVLVEIDGADPAYVAALVRELERSR